MTLPKGIGDSNPSRTVETHWRLGTSSLSCLAAQGGAAGTIDSVMAGVQEIPSCLWKDNKRCGKVHL